MKQETPVAVPADGRRGRAGHTYRHSSRRAPAGFVPLAAVALAFLALPVIGLVVRAPWRDMPADLTAPGVLTALRLSLICSFSAVALSAAVGVPLAWHECRSAAAPSCAPSSCCPWSCRPWWAAWRCCWPSVATA